MKMGKAAMKILGLKDEEFYEVRKLSQFWKIETTVVRRRELPQLLKIF